MLMQLLLTRRAEFRLDGGNALIGRQPKAIKLIELATQGVDISIRAINENYLVDGFARQPKFWLGLLLC